MAYGKPRKSMSMPSKPIMKPGTATTTSTVKNSSNSGEMSTSSQSTGATGAVTNTTVIRTQGDPGYSAGQESDVIKNYRKMMGL